MKLTKEQLDEIKEFVREQSPNNDVFHKEDHVENTARFAEYIARKERADVNKCIIAAWLHDIVRYKRDRGEDHGTEGAKVARNFLEQLNFPEEDINDICYAIQEHNKGGKKKTKEAEILWDADKIHSIGPKGFVRAVGYFCARDKQNPHDAYQRYLKELEIYLPRFYTKTAKKIIKRQNKFIKTFNKLYDEMGNFNSK